MIAGGFVAAAVACAIAFPCFKLRTHYFAMATLAIGETVRVLFLAVDWTGGANGLVLPVQRIPSTRDMLWAGKEPYLLIILAMAVAMTLVIVQVERSRLGIYLRAINQDEEAAARLGIDPRRYKLAALAGSAFVTGMTGTFYAQYTTYIDPFSVMAPMLSVRMVLVPVFGGLGTVAGPIIGAFVLIPLSETVRVVWGGRGIGIDQVVYGAIIVSLTLWMPGGVVALWRRRRRARLVPQPASDILRQARDAPRVWSKPRGLTPPRTPRRGASERGGSGGHVGAPSKTGEPPRGQRRRQALRRAHGAGRRRHHRRGGGDRRADRAERFGQDHALPLHRGRARAGRG